MTRPDPKASARAVGAPSFLLGTSALYSADLALSVVLTWSVLALSHSPFLAALALIANQAPHVAVGIVGVERSLGRWRSSGWLGLLGSVVALLALGIGLRPAIGLQVLLLIAAGATEGWANAVAVPVGQAWWMQATPRSLRVRAARDYEVASRVPRLLAPVAGGLLLADNRVALALSAIAAGLLASAWLWRRLEATAPGPGRRLGARDSWAVLRHDRWLAAALAVRGLANVVWPAFTIGLPWLVLQRLHQSAPTYGLILTVYGVSTLVLTIFGSRFSAVGLRRWYGLAWAATGLAFVGLAQAPTLAWAVAAVLLAGLGSPIIHMALDSHIGREVPAADQGSVFAFQRLIMGVMGLLGLLAVGAGYRSVGPATVLTAAGAVMGAAGLLAALTQARASGSRTAPAPP